jgi:hypothetical protein
MVLLGTVPCRCVLDDRLLRCRRRQRRTCPVAEKKCVSMEHWCLLFPCWEPVSSLYTCAREEEGGISYNRGIQQVTFKTCTERPFSASRICHLVVSRPQHSHSRLHDAFGARVRPKERAPMPMPMPMPAIPPMPCIRSAVMQ